MAVATLLTLLFPLCLAGETSFLKPGDSLWVGRGMALGYKLPFMQKLTVKKVRVMFMSEARVVFQEYPRRFYLRTDFGEDYAFLEDPRQKYPISDAQWQEIFAGRVYVGMSKAVFLLMKPKSREISVQAGEDGPVEQWLYRANPVELFGDTRQNPPTEIYYFQNDLLIATL